MPFGSEQWMYASGADFTIDQSLKFNDDDSAYLSFTPASASNRKTWTYSGWIKRGDDNSGAGGINHTLLDTTSGDGIHIRAGSNTPYMQINYANGSEIVTNQVFRDKSAWMHILVALDTTQGTNTNRIKIYVNGEQVTSFSSASYPSEDADGYINNNISHQIGKQAGLTRYFDGYMAEVHFIDGTALTPTSFGETGDYGEWKPIEVSGLTYGTNGFYLSFAGGGVMSATGGTITTDGDYKVNSFTADGTFTPSADGYVEYLVIGGGGGGGGLIGGGGGAGGYRTGYLAVTGSTAYSITVGAGGDAGAAIPTQGESSIFGSITSTGGGKGGYYAGSSVYTAGFAGGSGGGGSVTYTTGGAGGTSTAYGNNGGVGLANSGVSSSAAGGGGAGAVGVNGASSNPGNGGAGLASSITGSAVTKAGGGGGGGHAFSGGGSGGSGGGGGGTTTNDGGNGVAGTANTGSGGGGGGASQNGGAGGSGIVIIRYKFQ